MDADAVLEVVKVAFIAIVGLYVILILLHVLFGTPDPSGFL